VRIIATICSVQAAFSLVFRDGHKWEHPSADKLDGVTFVYWTVSAGYEMNLRIAKNMRLFLPWCLMTFAGLAPVMRVLLTDKRADWPDAIGVFGFFGGAAVLTALSFRDAQRLCSMPDKDEERGRLWSEKMLVLTVAILCAGLIACFVQTSFGTIVWRDLSVNAIEPVLLLVIIVCSTGFWTLLTHSVFGGLLLTGCAQFVLYLLLIVSVTAIDRVAPANLGVARFSHQPRVHFALSFLVAGFGLSYAAIMLWLGRRRFLKLEAPNDAT
jgi:hypothetical protein